MKGGRGDCETPRQVLVPRSPAMPEAQLEGEFTHDGRPPPAAHPPLAWHAA